MLCVISQNPPGRNLSGGQKRPITYIWCEYKGGNRIRKVMVLRKMTGIKLNLALDRCMKRSQHTYLFLPDHLHLNATFPFQMLVWLNYGTSVCLRKNNYFAPPLFDVNFIFSSTFLFYFVAKKKASENLPLSYTFSYSSDLKKKQFAFSHFLLSAFSSSSSSLLPQ